MDTRTGGREQGHESRHPIDLRPKRRHTEVEIIASEVYEFCVSLHVAFACSDDDFADFDVGRAWVVAARERCARHDPAAMETLGHFLGDERREALGGTLIPLASRCPEPRTVPRFLEWLATYPADQLIEVLLDQDGLESDWLETLAAALAAPQDEARTRKILTYFDRDQRPSVRAMLADPEATRRRLVAGLWGWYDAVFKQEIARIMPMVERERDALERLKRDRPREFMELAMHGVQWERTTASRIIFAPSYFSRPAVFYHYWDDVLTFCSPVDDSRLDEADQHHEPGAPDPDVLHFFEALGDRTRMRILRLLREKEMYLTELAEKLDLTKATTKFHMVKLRAAGLVTLHDRGRHTFYEARPDVARVARELLRGYLGAPHPPSPPIE